MSLTSAHLAHYTSSEFEVPVKPGVPDPPAIQLHADAHIATASANTAWLNLKKESIFFYDVMIMS